MADCSLEEPVGSGLEAHGCAAADKAIHRERTHSLEDIAQYRASGQRPASKDLPGPIDTSASHAIREKPQHHQYPRKNVLVQQVPRKKHKRTLGEAVEQVPPPRSQSSKPPASNNFLLAQNGNGSSAVQDAKLAQHLARGGHVHQFGQPCPHQHPNQCPLYHQQQFQLHQ